MHPPTNWAGHNKGVAGLQGCLCVLKSMRRRVSGLYYFCHVTPLSLLQTFPQAVDMVDKTPSLSVLTSMQYQNKGSFQPGESLYPKYEKVLFPEGRRNWMDHDNTPSQNRLLTKRQKYHQ